MNWLTLLVAGLFEIAFAFCLGKIKTTGNREVIFWYSGFVLSLIISLWLLIKATQTLPVGTAYAVWTGIGAFGTVLIGIFVFKEPISLWRLFFLGTLIASIIGLKLTTQ